MSASAIALPDTASLQALDQAVRYQQRNKIRAYFLDHGPCRREFYPKHIRLFRAGGPHTRMVECPAECDGTPHRERCFIAGNRVGKTDAAAFELTLHLTGLYDKLAPWWEGRRFTEPISAWACGDRNLTVRDIVQAALLGKLARDSKDPAEEVIGLGTGMIPAEHIRSTRNRMGIPNAIDIAFIKHISGGTSILTFKSYEGGRRSFEGTAQHFIWLDEEPPDEVYTECLIRTMTTDGALLLTFTPLMGLSPVVLKFLPGGKLESQ